MFSKQSDQKYTRNDLLRSSSDRSCLSHFRSAEKGLQIQSEEPPNHEYSQVPKSLRRSHANSRGKFGKCSWKLWGRRILASTKCHYTRCPAKCSLRCCIGDVEFWRNAGEILVEVRDNWRIIDELWTLLSQRRTAESCQSLWTRREIRQSFF